MTTAQTTRRTTARPVAATSVAPPGVLLELTLRKPGARRSVAPGKVALGADPQVYTEVQLFESENYRELARLDDRIRSYLRAKALPLALKNGSYLVTDGVRREIETTLGERFGERESLREAFLGEYPVLKRTFYEAHPKLAPAGGTFPPLDELRAAFVAKTRYVDWSDFCSTLWQVAAQEIRRFLRGEFLALVASFAESLGNTESGRRRPVSESTVRKLEDFVTFFRDRNVVDDRELSELVERVRALFSPAAGGAEGVLATSRGKDHERKRLRTLVREIAEEAKQRRIFVPGPEDDGPVH